eukprot:gene6392-biopygen5831
MLQLIPIWGRTLGQRGARAPSEAQQVRRRVSPVLRSHFCASRPGAAPRRRDTGPAPGTAGRGRGRGGGRARGRAAARAADDRLVAPPAPLAAPQAPGTPADSSARRGSARFGEVRRG